MAYHASRNRRGLAIALAILIVVALLAVFWPMVRGGGGGGGGPQPPGNQTTSPQPGYTDVYPSQTPSGYVGIVYVPADAVCNGTTCTITKSAYGYYDAFFIGKSVSGNATVGVLRITIGNVRIYPFGVAFSGGLKNFTSGAVDFRVYSGGYAYAYYQTSQGWIGVYMRVGNVSNTYYAIPGTGTGAPDRTLLARVEIDLDRGIVYVNGQAYPYEIVGQPPNTAFNYAWGVHIVQSGRYVVNVNPYK